MRHDRGRLYSEERSFYELEGNAVMKLTPKAAIGVCLSAADRGFVISRVEGGIWHDPGFEARYDCIWNGVDPPVDATEAMQNNREAAEFIRNQSGMHGAFILTVVTAL